MSRSTIANARAARTPEQVLAALASARAAVTPEQLRANLDKALLRVTPEMGRANAARARLAAARKVEEQGPLRRRAHWRTIRAGRVPTGKVAARPHPDVPGRWQVWVEEHDLPYTWPGGARLLDAHPPSEIHPEHERS